MIIGLLRNRHLLKGKVKKETQEKSVEAVLQFRAGCERGAERLKKLPQGITIKEEVINTIISEWIVPEKAPKEKLIFYVHGGGYVSGSCNDHRVIVSRIASNTGVTSFVYEYGLAPESPFPAALNDSLTAYKAIIGMGYKPENIVMMGESAGGGLCLSLLLALRDKDLPLPGAAAVISPWTDLNCSGESYNTRNKVSLAPLYSWTVFSHYYVAKNNVKDPYISPLYGNLKGLPPLFINAGDADELFDDSFKFYEKAKKADVDVTFREGKGMVHCYPLLAPLFPEATRAMNEISQFIKQKLS